MARADDEPRRRCREPGKSAGSEPDDVRSNPALRDRLVSGTTSSIPGRFVDANRRPRAASTAPPGPKIASYASSRNVPASPSRSIPEAARRLAIAGSTAYRLIAEGELEVIHIGLAVRVPADAVDSFVARRRAQGEAGARLHYGRPQRRAGKRM